jgi:membrane protein required for colicin V production
LSQAIAPYITVKPPLNRWLAMFGLYIFFSFLSFAAARSLKKWIDKAQFEEYDRHLGSIFGFVKGLVFVLVMTFFGFTLSQQMPEARFAIFHSQTGKIAAVIMDRLHPVMPKELHDVLEPYIHSLDRPGLDLQHAHDEDDHDKGHSHSGNDLEPIEAPPFLSAPRRGENDPPPFESLTGRDTKRPNDPTFPDFFDPPYPLPTVPALPGSNSIRPANGTRENRDNSRAEREKLLNEVASVLAEKPDAQQAIVTEIENSLTGLPDEIKLIVVKDWYTDLLVYDPNADPDRETDLSTPFDTRILRQLQLNNVPLSSLNTALKDRLQKSRR